MKRFFITFLMVGAVLFLSSCENCNHTFSEEFSYDEEKHWHAATCEHQNEAKDIADHTWDEGVLINDATEEAEGVVKYTCDICGYEKIELTEILAHTHKFASEWSSDAVNHWHKATCEDTEEVNGLAEHMWDEGEVTTPATEEAKGVMTYTCSVCSYEKEEEIPALEHEHKYDYIYDEGSHKLVCRCGDEQTSETHEFVDSEVEATKDVRGHILHTCDCGYSYQTNHTGVFSSLDEEVTKQTTFKILFIGNSYTFYNTSWGVFESIAEAEGYDVEIDYVTKGGYTLQKMADVNDEYGFEVEDNLKNNQYDVVFLQEQSTRPVLDADLFYDGVRDVVAKIKQYQTNARIILYETWGRHKDSSDLTKYNLTNHSMTQKLIAAYGAIASEVGAYVSHAGTAYYDVYNSTDEINLYVSDLYHPSKEGTYLVALTHYATVFGKSPIGVNHKLFTNESLQSLMEKAAHKAVFGESILEEEYRTTSEGCSAKPQEDEYYTTVETGIPTEWIDVTYKVNLGSWNVTKDSNGVATFTNSTIKSMLMFNENIFSNGGELSFDIKVDGKFTGASSQGVVFASPHADNVWVQTGDYYYCAGRNKTGKITGLYCVNGPYTNITGADLFNNDPMADVSKTYRVKVVANYERDIAYVYVDGSLATILRYKQGLNGGYIGLTSGISGYMTVSNIIVNGKGLKVAVAEPSFITNTGGFELVDNDGTPTLVSTALMSTVMLTDAKIVDGSVIEFDFKSTNFTGWCPPQGVILGASSLDVKAQSTTDNFYVIGRMNSGKIGGSVVINGVHTYTHATAVDSTALTAMADATKTYRIKIEVDYSGTGDTYRVYVDGTLGRTLTFDLGYRGEYFGFLTGAKGGTMEVSNIVIDGKPYVLTLDKNSVLAGE